MGNQSDSETVVKVECDPEAPEPAVQNLINSVHADIEPSEADTKGESNCDKERKSLEEFPPGGP